MAWIDRSADRRSGTLDQNDYSHEVRLARSGVIRFWLLLGGHLSVGLAVLGAFLPLLPTTPFLLLAAACYGRASARFYAWLLNTRAFGPMIINWRDHRAMPRTHKVVAIAFIAVSIGATVVFAIPHPAGQVALGGLGMGWIAVLLRLPTR